MNDSKRKHSLCIDLDGVLAKYDGFSRKLEIGPPIPGAKEFLESLYKLAYIKIYTCRTNIGLFSEFNLSQDELKYLVKQWLDLNEFKYDEIWCGQGKPLASAYIDDRGISCTPQKDGSEAYNKVIQQIIELLSSPT